MNLYAPNTENRRRALTPVLYEEMVSQISWKLCKNFRIYEAVPENLTTPMGIPGNEY